MPQKQKAPPRAEVELETGLCGTCNYGAECAHRSASRGPVHQCEQFLAESVPFKAKRIEEVLGEGEDASRAADSSFRGLCANCEERSVCRHDRPAGGIWHCEDYR